MAFLDILGGAAVAVLNLGLSNEIYLQLLGFSGLGLVDPQQPPNGGFDDDIRLLANGNVQFNDNQVVFDSLSPAITLTLSSVLLLSLDDVSMQDNQCDCDLLFDIVGIHALAFGWSVRMQGNRLKEPCSDRTPFLSGMTLGLFNDTSHNQGSHCFLDVGLLKPRITITSLSTASRRRSTPTGIGRRIRSASRFSAGATRSATAAGFPRRPRSASAGCAGRRAKQKGWRDDWQNAGRARGLGRGAGADPGRGRPRPPGRAWTTPPVCRRRGSAPRERRLALLRARRPDDAVAIARIEAALRAEQRVARAYQAGIQRAEIEVPKRDQALFVLHGRVFDQQGAPADQLTRERDRCRGRRAPLHLHGRQGLLPHGPARARATIRRRRRSSCRSRMPIRPCSIAATKP